MFIIINIMIIGALVILHFPGTKHHSAGCSTSEHILIVFHLSVKIFLYCSSLLSLGIYMIFKKKKINNIFLEEIEYNVKALSLIYP